MSPIHIRAIRNDSDYNDHHDGLTGLIHPEPVAAYLARCSTQSAGDLDPGQGDSPGGDRPVNAHLARRRRTVRSLDGAADELYPPGGAIENPYALLGKWGHMLGFRGHVASTSRRYSTTLGRLRSTRRLSQHVRARHPGRPIDPATLAFPQDDETTLVVGSWNFAGTGWQTEDQAALAALFAVPAHRKGVGKTATDDPDLRDQLEEVE